MARAGTGGRLRGVAETFPISFLQGCFCPGQAWRNLLKDIFESKCRGEGLGNRAKMAAVRRRGLGKEHCGKGLGLSH